MKNLANPASFVALCWAAFQIYMVYGTPLDLMVAVPIHIMFGVVLTFITHPLRKGDVDRFTAARLSDYLLAAVAVAIALHYLRSGEMLNMRIAMVDPLTTLDMVVGIATIVLVIEAVRRALGMGLTVVILAFLVYQFSGPQLRDIPMLGLIGHDGEPSRLFFETFLDMQTMQNEGVFGIPSIVSYNQVFYFLLFGAFLQLFGGGQLFMDLSVLLVGRFRGGMAKVSIVSSTLFGSVSGSATANAAVMGMFTIPAMKKSGMSAEEAAAVEATSSTGGQIMPPVMGAAAFLIAQFMGIPYAEVAIAALIPALLFYVALYFVVDLLARRKGLAGLKRAEISTGWASVLKRLYLLIPVFVLVYQIMAGRALSSATLQAIWITLVFGLCTRVWEGLRAEGGRGVLKATGSVFSDSLQALDSGARGAIAVAIPCAGAGIVVGIASITNLGLTFGTFVTALSGGMLIPALLLVMFMVIVMGMGMPTTAAYIMGAILAIPALDKLGVPAISAHFFVLYFAALSMVTPPVALAAFVAGGIAKANVWKTGWVAFRYSLAGFLVAFAFVFSPALLLQGDWQAIVPAVVTAVIGCYALAGCVVGYLRARNTLLESTLLFVAAALLIAPVIKASLGGLVLLCAVWAWQVRKARTTKANCVLGRSGA
ncbi:MAG: TRAP transporter fused permease subunit [Pseudomonas sp.]|uniref:TRAP transporter permease n=1 Tax=Pseudomonadota TaxID=1224 RepID=UPI00117B5A08|nr:MULTISPECIES: TRAP transporter fused permease subunit [Pseudomonadota]MPS91996.1 TRAP transporter fused permease subunit [Comamonas sp.]MPT17159.1 TRAP transporter fused permease subunit [Pseudomonas sp.]TRO29940.1 TRAP transporter fused permease subunit [Pseudomonas putida]WJH57919.1 TRAP transporter fused permease subunit [Pseudomonas guguanensis]